MIRVLSNNDWVATEVGGVQVSLFAWDELARVETTDPIRANPHTQCKDQKALTDIQGESLALQRGDESDNCYVNHRR
jgi:hypothetical protein